MRFLQRAMFGAVASFLALVLVGCPDGKKAAAPTECQTGIPPKGPVIDWETPFPGDELSSYREARAAVDFEPIEPENLGTPTRILVNRSVKALAFLFDDCRRGRIVVLEQKLGVSEARYVDGIKNVAADVDRNPSGNDLSDQSGSAEVVTIRTRRVALIRTAKDKSSRIEWTENGVEIVVEGPHLDRDACIEIAEHL